MMRRQEVVEIVDDATGIPTTNDHIKATEYHLGVVLGATQVVTSAIWVL